MDNQATFAKSTNELRLDASDYGWMALVALLCVLLRVFFAQGFVGSDDSAIIEPAIRVLEQGFYMPSSHYDARLGLVLPLSFAFSLFGVGLVQATLVSLFYSAGISLIVYIICRRIQVSQFYSAVAALTTVIMPLGVLFGSSNYPEIPFAFYSALSLLFVVLAIQNEKPSLAKWLLLGIFVSLFVAYMIKIEAVFVSIAYGMCFVLLRQFKMAIVLAAFTLGFFILEDIIVYSYDGFSLFNRLDMVTGSSVKMSVNAAFSHTQPWIFAKSMFVTFYNFGLHFYFVLAALVWAAINWKNLSPAVLISIFSFLIFFFWLQFGMTPKNLIHFLTTGELRNKSQLPRYLFMLVPFTAVLVGFWLDKISFVSEKVKLLLPVGLIGSMFVFIPMNEISYEHIKAYQQAPAKLKELGVKTIYADRATESYFSSIKEMGEIDGLDIKPLVIHDIHTGTTSRNPEFESKGGYVLINKNRYLYHNRRYKVKYPELQSLKDNGEQNVIVSNPSSVLSYSILELISWGVKLVLGTENGLSQKVLGTVNESLDSEDLVLYYVKPENVVNLEYMQ